ncbi:MAG: hypothetical protein ACRCZP_01280 [Phycicoccus sp.]
MTEKNGPGQADKKAAEQRTAEVAATDAAEHVEETASGDAAVVVDPYPAYEQRPLADLRALAKDRSVEINRDVEKAELVRLLRAKDPSPAYDVLPVEALRKRAAELDVELPEDFERAHLVTELRAADTHTG